MFVAEIIGFGATICSIVAFMPQVIKSFKTKSTKDLSLGMYTIFTTSQVLWLLYGIMITSLPVMITNAITFTLSLTILMYKLKYK